MKTVQDYLRDPRIVNDPEMAASLEPVKELHAIRLKLQDEAAGMSMTERVAFYNREGQAALVRQGLSVPLL